jgi:hypothetical protein
MLCNQPVRLEETMNSQSYGKTRSDAPTTQPRRDLRQLWTAVTTTLAVALFAQAVFAGAMLSGVGWGRAAHKATAVALIACALFAGLVAMVTLRRIANGMRLGLSLWALGAAICLQTVLGSLSTHGTHLMWVHVPLGVALVGLAMQSAARARVLGEDTPPLGAARR